MMAANDWRISVYNKAGKWRGFTFAATEAEARAQVPQVRCQGDRVTVAQWDPEWKDYRPRFTVLDDGWFQVASWKRYACRNCGHETTINTNHHGSCFNHCQGCSWKATSGEHPGAVMFGTWHRPHDCLEKA